jgi:hypothetical protein
MRLGVAGGELAGAKLDPVGTVNSGKGATYGFQAISAGLSTGFGLQFSDQWR